MTGTTTHDPADLITQHGSLAAKPSGIALDSHLEHAAHLAHGISCHLNLLVTACAVHAGSSLHLSAWGLSAGMNELSECAVELADQLDEIPILSDRHARDQLEDCWRIATRVSGLMRLLSETTSEPRVKEFELDIDDLMGGLQHLVDRMQQIGRALQSIQGRSDEEAGPRRSPPGDALPCAPLSA